jgi:restriction endonuclease S subunit
MQMTFITPEILSLRWDASYYDPIAAQARTKLGAAPCPIKELKDCVRSIFSGPFGSNLLEEEYVEDGLIIVRPVNLTSSFDKDKLVTIPRDIALTKGLKTVTQNTLLFARVGDPAVGTLPANVTEATISPNIIAAEMGDQSDIDFLFAYFSTALAFTLMNAAVKKVTQPTVGVEELSEIEVPFPSDKLQKAIGNKVKAFRLLSHRASELWKSAIEDVNKLIDGKLDEDKCFEQGRELAKEFGLELP